MTVTVICILSYQLKSIIAIFNLQAQTIEDADSNKKKNIST